MLLDFPSASLDICMHLILLLSFLPPLDFPSLVCYDCIDFAIESSALVEPELELEEADIERRRNTITIRLVDELETGIAVAPPVMVDPGALLPFASRQNQTVHVGIQKHPGNELASRDSSNEVQRAEQMLHRWSANACKVWARWD